MKARFCDLFLENRRARLQMYLYTWCISAAVGVSLLLGGAAPTTSATATSVLCLAIATVWTLAYCSVPHQISQPTAESVPRRLVFASVLAAISVALGRSTRKVEAATANNTLLKSTASGTLSSAERVTSVLKIVSRDDLSLPNSTKVQVRDAITSAALRNPSSEPISKAANALTEVARMYRVAPPVAAEVLEGIHHSALAMRFYPGPTDLAESNLSIAAFTRALELAANDTPAQSRILENRSAVYNLMDRFHEALADVKEAERLGGIDLSNAFTLEAWALVGIAIREKKNDGLPRAIALLTMLQRMDPPEWTSIDPRFIDIWRTDQIIKLAQAYYEKGMFQRALDESQLALTHPSSHHQSYYVLVKAYLALGNRNAARAAASRWLADSPLDGNARRMLTIIDSNTDPSTALAQIGR